MQFWSRNNRLLKDFDDRALIWEDGRLENLDIETRTNEGVVLPEIGSRTIWGSEHVCRFIPDSLT